MKSWLDSIFKMPDEVITMLIRFLEQNNGSLSKRVQDKEFEDLTSNEIKKIESSQIYFRE